MSNPTVQRVLIYRITGLIATKFYHSQNFNPKHQKNNVFFQTACIELLPYHKREKQRIFNPLARELDTGHRGDNFLQAWILWLR